MAGERVRPRHRWAVSSLTPARPLLYLCRPRWQVSEEPVLSSLTSLRIEQLLSRYPGVSEEGAAWTNTKLPGEGEAGHSSPVGAFPPAAAAAPGADLAGGVNLG